MDKKLRQLFDYQKFENNERLANVINQTLARYDSEETESEKVIQFKQKGTITRLSDDDLLDVNAAQGIGHMAKSNNGTVTCYCENCKKQTSFIVYSGARGKCSICGTMTDL